MTSLVPKTSLLYSRILRRSKHCKTTTTTTTKRRSNSLGCKIIQIPASQTIDLRERVLWPGKPEMCLLPQDKHGIHFGCHYNNNNMRENRRLVGVISLFFVDGRNAQFRKFAVAQEEQGKGIGSLLLQSTIDFARLSSSSSRVLYCDARVEQAPFYEKRGFVQASEPFAKYAPSQSASSEKNYVRMELDLS